MATWDQIIEDPAFQELPTSGQSYVRQQWFDSTVLPELKATGIDEANLNALRTKHITEYDNGQGYISSFASAAGRGAASTFTSAVQGVGSLTGSDDLEAAGRGMTTSLEESLTTNPGMGKINFAGNVAGEAFVVALLVGLMFWRKVMGGFKRWKEWRGWASLRKWLSGPTQPGLGHDLAGVVGSEKVILGRGGSAPDETVLYRQVAEERRAGKTDEALWLKCLVEHDGVESKALAAYTVLRIREILADSSGNAGSGRILTGTPAAQPDAQISAIPKQTE